MGVRDLVVSQYRELVNDAAQALSKAPAVPPEGWITTIRKALGMPGAELARRAGVVPSRMHRIEKGERDGSPSLKTMQHTAEALGCRFVYAIVPPGRVETLIEEEAQKVAREIVNETAVHMALENQGLGKEERVERIQKLAQEFGFRANRKLWTRRRG